MADDRKVAFNWYLNRQGPRGPQGVKGDTGFSPNISVETDTLNEYILRITNEGGYFLTSNLREHKEDRGGTYIRYDRDNGVMYAGEADTATDAKAGMIKIATVEDVEAEDESTAVTPAILADYVARGGGASIDDTTVSSSKVWSSEKTSQSIAEVSNQVATNTTDISNIKTALPNKQNKLTAGANITIEGDVISAEDTTYTAGTNITIENGVISSTGGGSGDVTLAGDNSFTGNNTFDGVSTFNGDTWVNSLKVGTSLTNQQNKKFLAQGSITAGTNVSIEETTDGIKISATGGGSSEPPSNMMTTDTTQMDLSGTKYWVSGTQLGIGNGLVLDENFVSCVGQSLNITKDTVVGNPDIPVIHTSKPYIVFSARQKLKFQYYGSAGYYDILDSSRLGDYVDGTTITYTNNKLTAVGGGGSYTLPPATATTLGGVIIGDGLTVLENGTLSAQVTGAQLEALQRLINDLSNKVDNLTTRLNNLEELIDGGIA